MTGGEWFGIGYGVVACVFMLVSLRWFPWNEPHPEWVVVGAICQGIIWPLAFLYWMARDFETTKRRGG